MWTRKDIVEFKKSIQKEGGDSIIKVGHGETVTVSNFINLDTFTYKDDICISFDLNVLLTLRYVFQLMKMELVYFGSLQLTATILDLVFISSGQRRQERKLVFILVKVKMRKTTMMMMKVSKSHHLFVF